MRFLDNHPLCLIFVIFFTKALSSPLLVEKISKLENQMQNLKKDLSDSILSLESKYEHLKEDLNTKFDSKVKREQRGKFVTEETFDIVAKKIERLQYLPKNLTEVVSKTYSDISKAISRTTITRDEFAQFQLTVARDTCKVRYHEGQWVTFQKRGQHMNPADYFNRPMSEYVEGFGNPSKEFWLGLDKLVSLTKDGNTELMIELETFEGKKIHAHYSSFQVVGSDYRLLVSGYSGDAGDTLKIDNGMAFSAKDHDMDLWTGDCSQTRGGGGWWYNGCGLANLNGQNFGKPTRSYDGILWYFYGRDNRSFKSSRMMIRKKL